MADQEMMALGASNLGAGISGGHVVTGALSKTSVAIASSDFGALATAHEDLRSSDVELWVVNPSLSKQVKEERVAGLLGVELPKAFESLGEAVAAYARHYPA